MLTVGDGGIVFTQVASLHGKSHRLIFDRKRNIFQFMLNELVLILINSAYHGFPERARERKEKEYFWSYITQKLGATLDIV